MGAYLFVDEAVDVVGLLGGRRRLALLVVVIY